MNYRRDKHGRYNPWSVIHYVSKKGIPQASCRSKEESVMIDEVDGATRERNENRFCQIGIDRNMTKMELRVKTFISRSTIVKMTNTIFGQTSG